jgi:hypothetical protein
VNSCGTCSPRCRSLQVPVFTCRKPTARDMILRIKWASHCVQRLGQRRGAAGCTALHIGAGAVRRTVTEDKARGADSVLHLQPAELAPSRVISWTLQQRHLRVPMPGYSTPNGFELR